MIFEISGSHNGFAED